MKKSKGKMLSLTEVAHHMALRFIADTDLRCMQPLDTYMQAFLKGHEFAVYAIERGALKIKKVKK